MFSDDESSVEASQPAELYTIVTPISTYLLTSAVANITIGTQTFVAAPIARNNMVVPELGKTKDLIVTVALAHPLAQELLVAGSPQRDVQVTIQRYQQRSGTVIGFWNGFIAGLATRGTTLECTVPSRLDEYVQTRLPILHVGRLCQHALYDSGCTLNQAATGLRIQTTIASIPNAGAGVYNLASIAGLVTGGVTASPLLFGFITRLADNEKRAIVNASGTTIAVDVPFRTLSQGDAVFVNVGCDRQAPTCRSKFNNIANHSGHPYLQTSNPLLVGGAGVMITR